MQGVTLIRPGFYLYFDVLFICQNHIVNVTLLCILLTFLSASLSYFQTTSPESCYYFLTDILEDLTNATTVAKMGGAKGKINCDMTFCGKRYADSSEKNNNIHTVRGLKP